MFNGLTIRDLLLIGTLIICVGLSVGLDYSKRKSQRLTEQNRTLQTENQLLAEQQKNQVEQLQRYQQQVDQLSNALQQQKQHADSRTEQLHEALQHEQNQTWRNQPVPDDIKRLFNPDRL